MNVGEKKAYDFLVSSGWKVQDLTQCEAFFGKDIDLLISRGQEQHYIEVKWDNWIHYTGNMFIETITDLDFNKDGWYKFCSAEFVFYGDSKNNLFYVYRFNDLKEYIKEEYSSLQARKAPDYNSKGQLRKVSQGLLVSIEDFGKRYPVQVIKL